MLRRAERERFQDASSVFPYTDGKETKAGAALLLRVGVATLRRALKGLDE